MTSFRFKLQKALEWRQTQLEMEEIKFRQLVSALAVLDRERAELEATGVRAEVEVRKWKQVSGSDLAALGSFRRRVRRREAEIAARRAERQKALETQQAAMLEARRRFRLLERLKERRTAEWKATCDRELEQLASESYLAGWSRGER